MRRVFPGGAVLGKKSRTDKDEVACRPLSAVEQRTRPLIATATAEVRPLTAPPPQQPVPLTRNPAEPPTVKKGILEHLPTLKLVLEVLVVFVGLMSAILALIGAILKWLG
jgi:hypothetical protein